MTDREAIEWFERRKAMSLSDRCQQAEDAALSALKEREERSNLPTADVAPVVHGKWIEVSETNYDYDIEVEEKCSRCGRRVTRYTTQPQDSFCPLCGAKMDGGDTQ